jgi:hypothetical protein
MTTDLRKIIATRLLTTKLPDGDVAAEMLLSADITDPVKMATPPNPTRCQNLVRGGFVKAATLAMSTDDPETLEKLARHASLSVKLAVVQNPAATDTARRIVEVAALKRSDDEILRGVLMGAKVSYILEGLRDDKRRARYIRVLAELSTRPSFVDQVDGFPDAFAELEAGALQSTLEDILQCGTSDLAETIGTVVGKIWPVDVDFGILADICTRSSIETEISFLSAATRSTGHLDSAMVAVIDRLLTRCEERGARRADIRHDVRLRGASQPATMTEDGRNGLIALCPATAKLVYGIDPRGETLEQISANHGANTALAIALNSPNSVKPDLTARRWMVEHVQTRDEDGTIKIRCDMNSVILFVDAIDDDNVLFAALQVAPKNLAVSYLGGQFGPVSEERARCIARVHPVDVVRGLRYIRGKEWGNAAIESAVQAASAEEILQSFHHLGDNLSVGELETLLSRLLKARQGRPDGRYSGLTNKPLADAAKSDDFVAHMDREELPGELLLQWLSVASDLQLTISYIKGERQRKMSQSEIDEIITRPDGAWGTNFPANLPRILGDLLESLPVETVDRIVDAAGGSVMEYLRRHDDQRFSQYLTERITRSGVSSNEWLTAFELFAKSPASVGAAISAAKRLGRARNVQQ